MTVAGRIMLNVILKNDSYKGFDKQIKIDFQVLKEVARAAVEYDEEDLNAQKEPTLMQSMMDMQGAGDSDDEDEDTSNTPVITKPTNPDKGVKKP